MAGWQCQPIAAGSAKRQDNHNRNGRRNGGVSTTPMGLRWTAAETSTSRTWQPPHPQGGRLDRDHLHQPARGLASAATAARPLAAQGVARRLHRGRIRKVDASGSSPPSPARGRGYGLAATAARPLRSTFPRGCAKRPLHRGLTTTASARWTPRPGSSPPSPDGDGLRRRRRRGHSSRRRPPGGVALDGDGNLYIADTGNHRIRKVDASTGIISTFAGTGTRLRRRRRRGHFVKRVGRRRQPLHRGL